MTLKGSGQTEWLVVPQPSLYFTSCEVQQHRVPCSWGTGHSASYTITDRGTPFRVNEKEQGALSKTRRPALDERLFIFLLVKIVFFTSDGSGGKNG